LKALAFAAASAALITLVGCTTFPVIQSGECGNAVIDADEDCDTFVPPGFEGSVCRPKGVPDEECHFDCRVNANGTRGACPTGWGCAANGVCRIPTDGFQLPARKFSSEVSSWLSSADFDGDGRAETISTEPPDQLQQGRFRLHYFDADSELVETRTFPRTATRPIASDLNGDQLSDIVFSNLRVGMLPGRQDREWIPAAFSSYAVSSSELRAVTVSQSQVGGAVPLLAFATLAHVTGIYVPSANNGGLTLLQDLSRPLQTLAGLPLAADIIRGAESPCVEVAFAFQDDDFFQLLDTCTLGGSATDISQLVWRDSPEIQVVHLPAGSHIDSGPISADVDGDGHLDILIGADGHTYVAHGDGQRLEEHAAKLTLSVIKQQVGEPPRLVSIDGPLPLAAGDITGDGVADYVMPDGVFGSRRSLVDSSLAFFSSYQNSAQLWTTAAVLDLNGNGLPDVIAASEGAPGLTFLSGTGGPFPVPTHISSQGPVKLIGTGDFDGDQITDVAFMQGGPPAASDSLAVAYGNRDRVPLDPVRVAELAGVQQLGGMRDASSDDIFTASTVPVDGAPRSTFTIFGGGAERLPFAPYTLVNFATDGSLQDWGALALIVGAFTAHGAHDVVAMGTHDYQSQWNQWLIPQVAGGQAPPRLLDGDPPEGVLPYTDDQRGVRLSVASVAADLDHDGLDEALWLMPRHLSDGSSLCSLLIYDVDAGENRIELKQQLDFDEPCTTPELVAASLGQPGLQLLALLGDPTQGPRRLEILWNDGKGGFSLDQRSFVHDRNNSDVRAFSVVPPPRVSAVPPPGARAVPPPRIRLAFVTESTLHIATTKDATKDGTKDGRELDDVSNVSDAFEDARGVVATDPNGDGISDLVVADAQGLWLLPAGL